MATQETQKIALRADGRAWNALREITFAPGIAPHALGSVLVSFGNTQVICAATIEEKVPRWMMQQGVPGGWLTAEYSMLPYSTHDRKQRDSTRGKIDGRSIEIQRLIGRSLRAAIDLKALGQRTLWVDCDVLRADGGTRTASITGACVATAIALEKLQETTKLKGNPFLKFVAAISAGVVGGRVCLDLNYEEDKAATVDANLVATDDGQLVEVQSSGEEATFSPEQMEQILSVSREGIAQLIEKQREAIRAQAKPADASDLASLMQKHSS